MVKLKILNRVKNSENFLAEYYTKDMFINKSRIISFERNLEMERSIKILNGEPATEVEVYGIVVDYGTRTERMLALRPDFVGPNEQRLLNG